MKESQKKKANAAYKQLNHEKVKQSLREAIATYEQSNPEKCKETFRKVTTLYRQSNLDKVKASGQKSSVAYWQSHPEKRCKRKLANSDIKSELRANKNKRSKCSDD